VVIGTDSCRLRAACCVLRGRAGYARRAWIMGGALALAGVTQGCAAEGRAEVIIRDSAGVRIVENPAANDELPQWVLDSVPRVSIGVLEGDEVYQLDQVGGALLHGGRVFVANGGSRDLRVFDLEGKHLATGGRKGGGPGEFEEISWVGPFEGDSVITFDSENRRFSIFDRDARFGRSIAVEEDFFSIAGRFADGSFLLPPTVSFGSQSPRNGLVRDSSHIVRVSAAGADPDTLMRIIAGEIYVHMSPEAIWARRPPFNRATRLAVDDTLFHTGTSDEYEIRSWRRDGRLVRVLRRLISAAPVTQADIDRYKAEQLGNARSDDARRELEKTLADMPYPDRMPAHGLITVDDDGNLWVQDYSPWTREPRHWTVFDREGRAIGRVELPARFELQQIGSDFALGVLPDDDDVEHVVIYGLARSASRAR
jgi:hypothetical protein